MLDHYFANPTKDGDISLRQQRSDKNKNGKKKSWDGKVTRDFVPRHLLIQLVKHNHMKFQELKKYPIIPRRGNELLSIVGQI